MKDLVLSFRTKSRELEEVIKKLGGVQLQAVSVDGSELEYKIQHDSAGPTISDFISYRCNPRSHVEHYPYPTPLHLCPVRQTRTTRRAPLDAYDIPPTPNAH